MDTYRLNAHHMYMYDHLPTNAVGLCETRFRVMRADREYEAAITLMTEQRLRLFSKLNERLLAHGVDLLPQSMLQNSLPANHVPPPALSILNKDENAKTDGVEISELSTVNLDPSDKVIKTEMSFTIDIVQLC